MQPPYFPAFFLLKQAIKHLALSYPQGRNTQRAHGGMGCQGRNTQRAHGGMGCQGRNTQRAHGGIGLLRPQAMNYQVAV